MENDKKENEGGKASKQSEEESHHVEELKTRSLGERSEGDESGNLCLFFNEPYLTDITMKGGGCWEICRAGDRTPEKDWGAHMGPSRCFRTTE